MHYPERETYRKYCSSILHLCAPRCVIIFRNRASLQHGKTKIKGHGNPEVLWIFIDIPQSLPEKKMTVYFSRGELQRMQWIIFGAFRSQGYPQSDSS